MQQVRERSNTSAYVILNKKGKHVATVQMIRGNSGVVQCDVWSIKEGETHMSLTHQGKAGGYGYDKHSVALSGAVIDGVRISEHGCQDAATERMLKAYRKACPMPREQEKVWVEKARKIGARFANWRDDGYTSLYLESGLDRLEYLGYQVICAV